jgi:UDP-glucose 4-epimerase
MWNYRNELQEHRMSRFLVTGGAGYVGSHTVLALRERGEEVVVLDDLRQGHRQAVPADVELVVASLSDRKRVDEVFASHKFDGVLHFAALSLVGESMREPMRYMSENLSNTLWLAESAVKAGCMRFVLSSTAALFGFPKYIPIDEDAEIAPVSAYGESKLMAETGLRWAERVHGLRSASLRYFNAAGADPHGRLGEDHNPETHLIPLAINAALGLGPELTVFGTDYDTPDGTCMRDYVHVTDLADAHVRVLDVLTRQPSVRYNVGNGTGYSVREVIETVERVSGRKVPYREGPRRLGDPAVLVASNTRLRQETGWQPRHESLDDIIRTAWAWRAAHPQGFDGPTVNVAAQAQVLA